MTVAWLSGIEGTDVQATVLSTPDERCRALLAGRSYKSAGFWQHVLSELAADYEGRIGRWSWSTFEFVTDRKFPKSPLMQARREQRLTDLVESKLPKFGGSLSQLQNLVTTVRQAETNRIWAIRSSLLELVSNFHRIVSSETHARMCLKRRTTTHSFDRLHLSLCANAVFQRTDTDASPNGSVELWKRRHFHPPAILLTGNIDFSRSSLVDCFVTEPDRIRDEWIEALLDQPFWKVGVASIYLAEGGDVEKVFRRLGHDNELDKSVDSETAITALFGEPVAALSQLEKILRSGKVSAFGVRTGSNNAELIPVPELLHMHFEVLHSERTIRMADRSGRSSLSWEHICINGPELLALNPPRISVAGSSLLSGRTQATGSSGIESRALKAATRWVAEHEANWSLSFEAILDWIGTEDMPLTNNAKDRLKAQLAQTFPFLSRKGPRPKKRPKDWPYN